jgi:Fe-S cluster biosynthesis and repair protein YggX
MAKKKAKTANPAPLPTTEQIDAALVQAARDKLDAGTTPTAREAAALKRWEEDRDEELRRKHYASVPQKTWREWSGRQTKILHDQAALYGLPVDRPTIDLAAVARWLHDFLATHHQKYRPRSVEPDDDGDNWQDSPRTPGLIRWQNEKAKLAKLDRLERERELLNRAEIQAGLAQIAAVLRNGGDALQKKCGPDALEIFTAMLDACERAIEQMLPEAAP